METANTQQKTLVIDLAKCMIDNVAQSTQRTRKAAENDIRELRQNARYCRETTELLTKTHDVFSEVIQNQKTLEMKFNTMQNEIYNLKNSNVTRHAELSAKTVPFQGLKFGSSLDAFRIFPRPF